MTARHDAVCFDAAEHLLDVAVPFVFGGLDAGEPTVVSLSERAADLVRAALPAGAPVTFLSGATIYSRPAVAIRDYRRLFAGHVADGAPRIRVLGELPREAFGPAWDWWARYETALNVVFDEFPVWKLCAYDTRVAPAAVLADIGRTHPFSFLPGGRYAANRAYPGPVAASVTSQQPEPLVELTDPVAAAVRETIREIVGTTLTASSLDGLLLGATEAVTNAHLHGKGPVRVRAWRDTGAVVVTVSDEGSGPADPLAGMRPDGGHGLWLSHLFCDHVALERGAAGGFTVRLTARQAAVTGSRTTASNT